MFRAWYFRHKMILSYDCKYSFREHFFFLLSGRIFHLWQGLVLIKLNGQFFLYFLWSTICRYCYILIYVTDIEKLTGTARTSLVITIGPSPRHRGETASTIMFGQRVGSEVTALFSHILMMYLWLVSIILIGGVIPFLFQHHYSRLVFFLHNILLVCSDLNCVISGSNEFFHGELCHLHYIIYIYMLTWSLFDCFGRCWYFIIS